MVGVVVLIIGLVAGGITWHQLTKLSIENDEVAYYIEAARPLYRDLPRLTVEPDPALASAFESSLYEAFRAAEVVGIRAADSDGYEVAFPSDLPEQSKPSIRVVTRAMHEDLIRDASRIVSKRFASDDPSEYIEYREKHGAVLSSARYDKHFPYMFESVATRIAGAEKVESSTPRSLFEAVFDRHVPSEVASGRGMAIAYGLDSRAVLRADLSEASLGYTGWSGGLSLGVAPMTTWDETRDEMLDRYGPLVSASVGFVTYYPDRSPRPMAFWFNWHPQANQWVLMRVMLMNFPNAEAMAAMYPEF